MQSWSAGTIAATARRRTFLVMTEPVENHAHLTAVALALYDVTDVVPDLRVVLDRARWELVDLAPELLADLLIVGSARTIGIDSDVPGLVALWGADTLHRAAPRLVEVLATIAGHP
jgi:hypothetical protein